MRKLSFIHWFTSPMAGMARARIFFSLPHGFRGPKSWVIICSFPRLRRRAARSESGTHIGC